MNILRIGKQHVHGHDHATNHDSVVLCHEGVVLCHKHIRKCKMCRVAMGLVCIRPNGGAEKMEPFVRVLEAHHAHLNSSVEVQCHFIFQLVGLASKDVNLLTK